MSRIALLLALSLSLTLVCSGIAHADRSLNMEKVNIEAELLPDASMRVTERLTIDFSGQWNGFFVKIPIGDMPIKEVAIYENGQPYKYKPGTDYGPPGTYILKKEGNELLIDWSIAAQDETRTFDVSYRVINAVKIHNDTAELYRKFIGSSNQQRIDQVNVRLKLPPGAENYKQGEDIRIWGHGPLNGEVEFTGPAEVTWQTSRLQPYVFVEGRVVMPLALFPKAPASTKTGQDALAGILEEESAWAKEANRERWLARAEIGGGAGIALGALGIVFLLWRSYGRKHPVTFEGEYYRELPADYSPGELSSLWNFKKIQTQDLTATIMDLARRKFLRIDEEMVEKRKLFGHKEIKVYRLTFLEAPAPGMLRKPEDALLRDHEQELLDYLKANIAQGKAYLYLHEIEGYAKKYSEDFYEFWQHWSGSLKFRGEELGFFDFSGNMPLVTLLFGLAMFIGGLALMNVMTFLGIGVLVSGILFMLIPRGFKRRSISGQDDFARWQAFRRFLLHFSQMERHEIPSLIIWEHYLVYAVTLGVAREVIKQLEVVFPNMQDGDHRFGTGWYTYGAYTDFDSFNNTFNGISSSLEQAVSTAQKAVSKSSSDSGGGGGFSSGGGGGGGGSSYGGR